MLEQKQQQEEQGYQRQMTVTANLEIEGNQLQEEAINEVCISPKDTFLNNSTAKSIVVMALDTIRALKAKEAKKASEGNKTSSDSDSSSDDSLLIPASGLI